MGSHGLGEHVEREALLLHRQVAGWIGARCADESHVDWRCLVEQPLFAFDFHVLDDVFLRHLVDLAAAKARIDIGVQTYLREETGRAGGARAIQLRDDTLGQVVARDLVFLRGLRDLRHAAEVCGDDAREQTFVMQSAGAEAFAIARASTHDERAALGRFGFDVAFFECGVESLGNAALDEARRADHITVLDQRNGLLGGNDFVFRSGFHGCGVSH